MIDIIEFLDVIGRIITVVALIGLLWGIYAWFKGILPAVLRLGNGLAKRKIAIFAKGDHFGSLQDLLLDSELFSRDNIARISTKGDIGKAEDTTLFLIFWHDWQEEIEEILRRKTDGTALVIYAPQELGFIPKEMMGVLNTHRNVMVTNFRGRLLNDVVVSMITTSYEK